MKHFIGLGRPHTDIIMGNASTYNLSIFGSVCQLFYFARFFSFFTIVHSEHERVRWFRIGAVIMWWIINKFVTQVAYESRDTSHFWSVKYLNWCISSNLLLKKYLRTRKIRRDNIINGSIIKGNFLKIIMSCNLKAENTSRNDELCFLTLGL